MAVLRVLHLVGSPVSDFHCDLSRLYAQDCLSATADPGRYEFLIGYVTPDGRWRFPRSLEPDELAGTPSYPAADALPRVVELRPDVVVPQLFCRPGMTTYRAVFDLLGIPYVGNSASTMALGADKAQARAVVAAAGVDVPAGEVVGRGQVPNMAAPAVVKPVDDDNSVGLSLVRDSADYPAALDRAFEHSDRVLVESYVELGREVRCGVLVRDGRLQCLPLEEYAVDRDTKPIRDRADKLARDGGGDLRLTAKTTERAWIVDPSDPITPLVWAAARRCHDALGCRDYSLFDFRIDPGGRPWFLEAGLYCSFAEQSVISVMAKAAGIELPELFDSALRQAIRRQPTVT